MNAGSHDKPTQANSLSASIYLNPYRPFYIQIVWLLTAQQRVRFDDQHRLSPMSQATGPEQQPDTIDFGLVRPFVRATQDPKLLPQQDVLSDEFGASPCHVAQRHKHRHCRRWAEISEQPLFQPVAQ